MSGKMTNISPSLPGASGTKQVAIVTILRGLAATSVFLFHLVCLSHGFISGRFLEAIFGYGRYGVQFFFVISGFVIPYSMMQADYRSRDFLKFLQKRIVRIEPPYLCVLLLNVIFLVVRSKSGVANGDTIPLTWQQVALHVGYLIPFSPYPWINIVFWTLAIEFQFYLLFSLIYTLFVGNRWYRWLISLVLVAVCFFTHGEDYFFYWSPIFLMGIHVALVKMNKLNTGEFWWTIAVLAGIVLYKLGWIIDLFALTAVFAIYFEPVIKSRLLEFLGSISYSLYLCHTLIVFPIINLGIRFSITSFKKVFLVISTIAATLLFSYLLYYFVERPAKKWAAAIKYRP